MGSSLTCSTKTVVIDCKIKLMNSGQVIWGQDTKNGRTSLLPLFALDFYAFCPDLVFASPSLGSARRL